MIRIYFVWGSVWFGSYQLGFYRHPPMLSNFARASLVWIQDEAGFQLPSFVPADSGLKL